ncbi:MAG: V-type ATPase subunit [Clostridia bacterium]|nr:V-type ATPase subunit [Clostridia bacterium]
MRQDTNYAYAVGRIRVLEKSLLKDSDYDALIDASDEVFETQVAGTLTTRFTDTVREVMKFAPEPDVLSIFLLPADYGNAKICVKSIAGRSEVSGELPELSSGGMLPPEMIWDAVRTGERGKLDPGMFRAITRAMEELSVSGSARKADMILDRACFINMRELVSKGCYFTRRYMGRYLDIYADWTNILTAERIASTGGDAQLFKAAYLRGSIPSSVFVDNLSMKRRAYDGTAYAEHIDNLRAGLNSLQTGDNAQSERIDIVTLEKIADNFMARYLAENKSEPYRIDALAAYLGALKLETQNLRIIAVGRRSGAYKDTVRNLLRLTGRV